MYLGFSRIVNHNHPLGFVISWSIITALCWSVALLVSSFAVSSWMLRPFALMGLYRCHPVDIPERPILFVQNLCSQSWFILCFALSGIINGALFGYFQAYNLRNLPGLPTVWRKAKFDGFVIGYVLVYLSVIAIGVIAHPLYQLLETLKPEPLGASVGLFTISLAVGGVLSAFMADRYLACDTIGLGRWRWTNSLIVVIGAVMNIQLFRLLFFYTALLDSQIPYFSSLVAAGLLSGLVVGILQGYEVYNVLKSSKP